MGRIQTRIVWWAVLFCIDSLDSSGFGNVRPLCPVCSLGLAALNQCVDCLFLTVPCCHCPSLTSLPPTSITAPALWPSPLLTAASCPCDPVCTLLPECVSKEFMSESPFLIEIWASVHLYIHRARLHRTFWKKELAFHTIGAFSHLWVRPARNLCRYNPVHWHPRKSFAAADCKPPYGLWMLKHWYFFPDKTNIFHSRVDIFLKC